MKTNKILSLQKHLEKVKNQASNPKRTGEELNVYIEWMKREIKRTESMIVKLKG